MSANVAPADPDEHPFKGRTVAIVNDLTLKEQWYLYQKTRELKQAIREGKDLNTFRLRNSEFAVYTIFMEDSTRTKESFRNAAEFHGMKVNVFDAKTSSFQKNETITDTIKMLCGYSIGQSIFVIRSKIEGVCTWLEEAITEYTKQRGFPRASFVNAGDGRHEHPSQELLDEFSFLETKGWDTSEIHLALIGDLFHGRTVHSKVDGLRLYGKVDVDLIAPTELALPKHYEEKMIKAGFNVRKFMSLDEYLQQPKVAKLWYFTRLQLERMGDKVLDKQMELRRAVTFQREFLTKLPEGTKFFHPLPRDSRHPVLPFWLDNTELNGWDQQSQNGYFTRIVLLGMLGGHFGADFRGGVEGPSFPLANTIGSPHVSPFFKPQNPSTKVRAKLDKDPSASSWSLGPSVSALVGSSDFVRECTPTQIKESRSQEAGLVPIQEGVVIERLGEGQSVEKIWGLMYMVRSILGLLNAGGQGVLRPPDNPQRASGFISVPDFDINAWDRQPLKKLAAIAPGSILKVISAGKVLKEFQLTIPPRVYGFDEISCRNTACVSHPSNGQREVKPYFLRVASDCVKGTAEGEQWRFACKYCEAPHDFWQIWDYKRYNPNEL